MSSPDSTVIEAISVARSATLLDALGAIQAGAVGLCLVLEGDGRYRGVLSDGDIRRALLAGRGLDDSVDQLVQSTSLTVDRQYDRAGALELMQARGLGAIPILENEHVVGLHTLRSLLGLHERPNWTVLMAGGRGSRLGSLTDTVPKPMMEVAGRPLLERILLQVVGSGFSKVAISVNYLANVIEDYFGDGSEFGAEIIYLREDAKQPLGTAGCLTLLNSVGIVPDEPILVSNGDVLNHSPLGPLMDHHIQSGCALTVAASKHEYRVPYGVLRTNAEGHLTEVAEKPEMSWKVAAGVSVLDADLLQWIPSGRQFDMPELYVMAMADERGASVYDLDSSWIDVGRPDDLARARGQRQ